MGAPYVRICVRVCVSRVLSLQSTLSQWMFWLLKPQTDNQHHCYLLYHSNSPDFLFLFFFGWDSIADVPLCPVMTPLGHWSWKNLVVANIQVVRLAVRNANHIDYPDVNGNAAGNWSAALHNLAAWVAKGFVQPCWINCSFLSPIRSVVFSRRWQRSDADPDSKVSWGGGSRSPLADGVTHRQPRRANKRAMVAAAGGGGLGYCFDLATAD